MVELTVSADILKEVEDAVGKHQPELVVAAANDHIILEGPFVVSAPAGPYDSFKVKVGVFPGFPWVEPVVFETGGRIPKEADRHVFPKHGVCCLGVWEEWLLVAPDQTFEAFLTGVMHDYFVSQTYLEAKCEWPFGERSHGTVGVLESFADLLGVENAKKVIADHLRLLARDQVKGHAMCPCGSGRRLRHCHRDKLEVLQSRIDQAMAKRMLDRVEPKPDKTAA